MADEPETTDIPIETSRVPIDCSVDLRFDRFSGFARMYAANISSGGMFIRTAEMQPPGSTFEFNFELADGQPLIRGTAEVVWCRAKNHGRQRPRGLGVRFLTLDLESKLVIYRLVDEYIQGGGTPFELGREETDRRGSPAGGRRRALLWALAVLAMLAVGGTLGFWLLWVPGEQHREAGTGERGAGLAATAGEDGGAPVAEPAAPESPAPSDVSPSAPRQLPPAARASELADHVAAVEAAIAVWKQAWSAKNVERYLSCYSEDFRPASGLPLSVWRSQRRDRLTRPGFIEVDVASLEVEMAAADRAIARFDQTYASTGYRDRVRKSLELVHREGEWKVLREEVLAELATEQR